MKNGESFEEYLRKTNLSKDTKISYLWTVKYFTEHYDSFSKENLLAYKGYLLEYFKPKTVNLRIQGINKYLCFIGKEKLQLRHVKVQQKNFLENVIGNADYQFLKTAPPVHSENFERRIACVARINWKKFGLYFLEPIR